MKVLLILFIAMWVGTSACLAQDAHIDFAKLRLSGLPFTATKAQVIQRLGKPRKIDEPHYECGFLSSQEQGKKMYSLHYGYALFTGNAKDGYLMEEVNFSPKSPVVLLYGPHKLSGKTTLKDLEKVFGYRLEASILTTAEHKKGLPVVSIRSKQDDAAMFWFENGYLVRFEYWSPC